MSDQPAYNLLTTKSLEDFLYQNSSFISDIDNSTLCIFDIDGVFFPGLLTKETITETISRSKLMTFKKIIKLNCNVLKRPVIWVFTSRPYLLKIFPYFRQLQKCLKPNLHVFKDSQEFLDTKINLKNNNLIIFNAQKTKEQGINTVKVGLRDFKKVFYFASQDFPWTYPDRLLLDKLSNDYQIEKLTFVDIRK